MGRLGVIVMLVVLLVRMMKGENCLVFLFIVESFYLKFNCVYIVMVEFDLDDDKIVWILYEWFGSIFVVFFKVVFRFREIFVRSFVWLVVIKKENKLNISMWYVWKMFLDKKKNY